MTPPNPLASSPIGSSMFASQPNQNEPPDENEGVMGFAKAFASVRQPALELAQQYPEASSVVNEFIQKMTDIMYKSMNNQSSASNQEGMSMNS